MKKFSVIVLLVLVTVFGCSKDEGSSTDPTNPPGSGTTEPTNPPNPPKPPAQGIPTELAIDSIQIFDQMLDGNAETERLGLRFPFSDFYTTGVYVKPNATLMLTLTIEKAASNGALPELLVGTFSHGTDWNHSPKVFSLERGNNEIHVGSTGGMVYVRYLAYQNPDGKAKLKFLKGWEHSPLFRKGDTTNDLWKRKLEYFKEAPSVTLEGDRCFLVVSRNKALEYKDEDQEALLDAIDGVIRIENEVSGMNASVGVHAPVAHKLLMSEYQGGDYYMFAYYYRTAYRNSDAIQYILDENEFTTQGWGPWHEIGHMHQMDAWTWSAVVETTVNIYSLAVEREMGITPNRLVRDGVWARVADYLALPNEQKDFNGNQTDVWMRLAMFQQLWLAFGDDFYPKMHQSIRVLSPYVENDEARMSTFMLHASRTAGVDLSEFFKTWGFYFSGSDEAYQKIANLGLPQPTTDISALRDQ